MFLVTKLLGRLRIADEEAWGQSQHGEGVHDKGVYVGGHVIVASFGYA